MGLVCQYILSFFFALCHSSLVITPPFFCCWNEIGHDETVYILNVPIWCTSSFFNISVRRTTYFANTGWATSSMCAGIESFIVDEMWYCDFAGVHRAFKGSACAPIWGGLGNEVPLWNDSVEHCFLLLIWIVEQCQQSASVFFFFVSSVRWCAIKRRKGKLELEDQTWFTAVVFDEWV